MTRRERHILNSEHYHEEAMMWADRADALRRQGKAAQAWVCFASAHAYESWAARTIDRYLDLEPSRSVLYRSAASLALECGQREVAAEHVARGLAGNPPEEIADELREIGESLKAREGSQ